MITGGARARVDADRPVERPERLRGASETGLFAALDPVLFLVDGNNLLWRAAHSHPAPFPASDGRDLTPVFRFFSLLRRALGTYGVFAECVVCFDGAAAWGRRRELDGAYKSNRDYDRVDVGFMEWLPEIRAALEGAGIGWVEVPDLEADDVIGALTVRADDRRVRILSTDRDYVQLVGPTVHLVDPRRTPWLVTEETVVERHGVEPGQWCDFRALAGDPSDGIPGVAGVGPKRAAVLLRDGVTLEDLPGSGRLTGAVGRRVADRWEDVHRWRELVRLRTDAPVGLEPTGTSTPRLPSPTAVCRELGLLGPHDVARPRGRHRR